MPQLWLNVPVVRGVVTTRRPENLEPGELVSAENVRLSAGDNVQLHPDRTFENTDVPGNQWPSVDGFAINFENGKSYLLVLEVNAGFTYFVFHDTDDLGTRQVLGTPIFGEVVEAAIQHYGNVWFLGTNLGNYVIEEGPTVRQMGLGPTYESDDIDYNGYLIAVARTDTGLGQNSARWPYFFPEDFFVRFDEAPWEGKYYFEKFNEAFAYDMVFYCVTRYDVVNNIESAPFLFRGYLMASARRSRTSSVAPFGVVTRKAGCAPRIYMTTVEDNPDIKYRIYRYYAGNTALKADEFVSEVDDEAYSPEDLGAVDPVAHDEYLNLSTGQAAPIGFLIAEITPFTDNTTEGNIGDEVPTNTSETVWADYSKTKANVGRALPTLDFSKQGALLRTLVFRKPRPWVAATVWSEVFVAAQYNSGQVLDYSPRGELEYQPDIYKFVIGPTRRSDRFRALTVINGQLLVLTAGSVHRVLWLLQEGAQFGGPEQVVVTSRHGCVGKRAFTTFSTEIGELMLWLSEESLVLSDGQGWRDGCPDWSVRTALPAGHELENAILVNDERDYRVLLFVPTNDNRTTVWAFYYHPLHRKEQGLTALGPSTLPYRVRSATTMKISGENEVFILVTGYSSFNQYNVLKLGDSVAGLGRVVTGYISGDKLPIRGGHPFLRLRPLLAALKSKPLLNYNVAIKASGLPAGTDTTPHDGGFAPFDGAASAPHLRALLDGVQAPVVQCELVIASAATAADRNWAVGPLSIKFEVEEAFDG